MLLSKAQQLYEQWIDIELTSKDKQGKSIILEGLLETISEQGITISNNQPTAGGYHDTDSLLWEEIHDIRTASNPGHFKSR